MFIKLKNVGVMRQAEFEPGDMTIICGQNNTGKTYATYTLYGFHSFWNQYFIIKDIDDKIVETLLTDGVVKIDIQRYADYAQQLVTDACEEYSDRIANVFSTSSDYFKNSTFDIDLKGILPDVYAKAYNSTLNTAKGSILSANKEQNSSILVISSFAKGSKLSIPKHILKDYISSAVKEALFEKIFAMPFIASAERTGAAIFRRELNFARNRLLEELSSKNKEVNPLDLLTKVRPEYPLPVEDNVNFTRQLETLAKDKSFIAEEYPDIIEDFQDIIGGDYHISKSNDELYYVPKGKRVRLSLDTSSSAVRSLLDIGFYLRHEAAPGDFIIIDEPELNLHPENQRRIARLFARLLNIGIRVFITTHSDYIIRELNTLIMMNQDKDYIRKIMEREEYKKEELINSERVRVYVAGESQMKCDGAKRKVTCCTLTEAEIDPIYGIKVESFDETINKMNQIQDDIMWGEDE